MNAGLPVKSVTNAAWQSKGQGPPISFEYKERDGTIFRVSEGKEMSRADAITSDGPRDSEWRDEKTGVTYRLRDRRTNAVVLGPVGRSVWQHGPNVPANADCRSCHRIKSVETHGISFASLAKIGPVEAGLGLAVGLPRNHCKPYPKHPPTKPPVVVVKEGPAGPRGFPGKDGGDGMDGKDGDVAVIIAWLEANKDKFKGKDGTNGTDGTDGNAATVKVGSVTTVASTKPATVVNTGSELAAVFNFEIPRGADGSGGEINYDVLVTELLKRLPPIHIGVKDTTGKVTMPLTKVPFGEGVYIQVSPPSLTEK